MKSNHRLAQPKDWLFICQNIPFIRHGATEVLPFVSKNAPSVSYKRAQPRGFTLVELLITLVIIAITAVIGGPAIKRFLESNRLTTASNDLIVDLNYARTEAIKRRGGSTAGSVGQVAVCVSSNQTDCSSTADWNSGWIVFWDQNRSGTFQSSTDVLIRTHVALPSSISATTSPSNTRLFAFDPMGKLISSTQSRVTLTNSQYSDNRLVCITPLGQAAIGGSTC